MRRFVMGFVVGLMLGGAGVAVAAQIIGSNGYLVGWDVRVKGQRICSDPFVWVATKEIEC
jgi:hypothetical protein